MDLQDQQEDCVLDGVDGGGEGTVQDLPALPAHVLATGIQGLVKSSKAILNNPHIKGADINKCPG